MISAWFNAFLGVALVGALGELKLGLTPADEAVCILASNVAGLFALFAYTWATRHPWTRRHAVNGAAKTWSLFLVAYFGPLLLLAKPLRDPVNFAWLVVPVILTTGFAILIFGPVQDGLIARGKRH